MDEGLGSLAYRSYGQQVGWKTFTGTPMPSWAEQNEKLKEAWNTAAQAVADKVQRDLRTS